MLQKPGAFCVFSLPHLSLFHPTAPPPRPPFPCSSDLFPLKCHAREMLSRMKEKTRGTLRKKKVFQGLLENKQKKQKTKSGYCQLALKREGKQVGDVGGRQERLRGEWRKKEKTFHAWLVSQVDSCVTDIQVETWTLRSSDATKTPYHNLWAPCALTCRNSVEIKAAIYFARFTFWVSPDNEVKLRAREHEDP